jgi:hypothetical protein
MPVSPQLCFDFWPFLCRSGKLLLDTAAGVGTLAFPIPGAAQERGNCPQLIFLSLFFFFLGALGSGAVHS